MAFLAEGSTSLTSKSSGDLLVGLACLRRPIWECGRSDGDRKHRDWTMRRKNASSGEKYVEMGNGCESDETFCGPARLRPSHPSITPCYDHMRQRQIQGRTWGEEDAKDCDSATRQKPVVQVDRALARCRRAGGEPSRRFLHLAAPTRCRPTVAPDIYAFLKVAAN